MGTASATDGFDLHMIDLGDAYAFSVGSQKGADLFKGFHQVFEAIESDLEEINATLANEVGKLPLPAGFRRARNAGTAPRQLQQFHVG
jgi:hypothetical protein